jgi:hypothetical protein
MHGGGGVGQDHSGSGSGYIKRRVNWVEGELLPFVLPIYGWSKLAAGAERRVMRVNDRQKKRFPCDSSLRMFRLSFAIQ